MDSDYYVRTTISQPPKKDTNSLLDVNSSIYSEDVVEAVDKWYEKHIMPAPDLKDQSIKADAGKPRLSLVPTEIIRQIARVREYGVNKYGDKENWKAVSPERYRDAAFRHFLAYLEEPDGVDEESGLPHLAHLACNIAFLCELEKGIKHDEDDGWYVKNIKALKENHSRLKEINSLLEEAGSEG